MAGSGAVTSSSCSSAISALRLLLTLETSLRGQGGCSAGDALNFLPSPAVALSEAAEQIF